MSQGGDRFTRLLSCAHTFYNPKMSLSLPSAFAEVSLVRLRPHVASIIVTWFSGFAYSNLVLKIGF
jgi:hypothetical protein